MGICFGRTTYLQCSTISAQTWLRTAPPWTWDFGILPVTSASWFDFASSQIAHHSCKCYVLTIHCLTGELTWYHLCRAGGLQPTEASKLPWSWCFCACLLACEPSQLWEYHEEGAEMLCHHFSDVCCYSSGNAKRSECSLLCCFPFSGYRSFSITRLACLLCWWAQN